MKKKSSFKKKIIRFFIKLSIIMGVVFIWFYMIEKAHQKGTLPLKGQIFYYGIKLIIISGFLYLFYIMLRDFPQTTIKQK